MEGEYIKIYQLVSENDTNINEILNFIDKKAEKLGHKDLRIEHGLETLRTEFEHFKQIVMECLKELHIEEMEQELQNGRRS